MTLPLQKPFDADSYLRNVVAVRNRLMKPQNAFKPILASLQPAAVSPAPERPSWRSMDIGFDAHVQAYQWQLAQSRANRAQEYIKARCIELGADHAKVTDRLYKKRDITGPRQLIMYELKTKFELSYPRIGREMGGFDHSTVLHAVTRIAKIRGEERPGFVTGTDRLLGNPALKNDVKNDYLSGMSVEDLAEKFAISEVAIVKVSKMENWHKPNRVFLKGQPFRSVSVDTATMQVDYESGLTLREIALKHQVSDTTIRRIRDRQGWAKRAAR